MASIRVENIQPGQIDSERIAVVEMADGKKEEVFASVRQIKDSYMDVGEVGRDGDLVLVELPRESVTGRWRVWVKSEAFRA